LGSGVAVFDGVIDVAAEPIEMSSSDGRLSFGFE
jgi:hypothetical protein